MPGDRPTFAFGDLNPVEKSKVGRALDPRNTRATDIIRESARSVFREDALANSGPFKGIVLREEKGEPEPNSWVANIFGSEKRPRLKALKIRIPEIHAALPEPARYGDNAGSSHKIIDMYPTFISATEEISSQPVAPGDIVLCDFQNRENLTHPTYFGPAFDSPAPGAVGVQTAKATFADGKKQNLAAQAAPGDDLFGSKNSSSQIPGLQSPGLNPGQLNNANSTTNRSRVAEAGHERGNPRGGLPPMREREIAFRRGNQIGVVELVEVPPPNASKEGVFITKQSSEMFFEMCQAAQRDGIRIVLNSGFRSFDQQRYLYDGYKSGLSGFNLAARPGYSNHQSGIAFDIKTGGPRSQTYVWLSKNAHKFGFINAGRFFKQQREYWHWEFRGVDNPRVLAEGRLPVRKKQEVFFA